MNVAAVSMLCYAEPNDRGDRTTKGTNAEVLLLGRLSHYLLLTQERARRSNADDFVTNIQTSGGKAILSEPGCKGADAILHRVFGFSLTIDRSMLPSHRNGVCATKARSPSKYVQSSPSAMKTWKDAP
jgi:hypothetical protein